MHKKAVYLELNIWSKHTVLEVIFHNWFKQTINIIFRRMIKEKLCKIKIKNLKTKEF